MGGDYEKGVYNQLMEVMEKLNVMESEPVSYTHLIPVSYFSFNSEAVSPEDIEAISVRYYRILSPQFNPCLLYTSRCV